jgi:NAD dependent epimerase/dehydratase
MELKNKVVVVTGADGFIGSHLVEELVSLGADVRAMVYYNSFNSWGWLDTLSEEVKKKITVIPGDIRDTYGVKSLINGADIVFHLAALITIPFSYNSPNSYVDTNVSGTLNVLQACKEYSVSRVLITSTSEVYGTAKFVPITELHPKQPQSPYSATKIGADSLADSFYRSFDLPITIVRPFNTYGPRQSARAIIPTIITQLLNGYEKINLGDLTPTRDFVFVKDTVGGFIEIAKSESLIGQECNIATQSEISMKELAEELIKQINPKAQIISDFERIRPIKSEVFRLFGSNLKLIENTGWKQKYTFEMGIKETISWFSEKGNLVNYKSDKYNI